jgi:hypothetical protein
MTYPQDSRRDEVPIVAADECRPWQLGSIVGKDFAIMGVCEPSDSLLLLARTISNSMRQKQVLGKEILCKVVELHILGTESIGCGNPANAGKLVHIL